MAVWAIADLHLPFGAPEKTMEAFKGVWIGYVNKLEKAWKETVLPEDLVLIAGDISWAMHLDQALKDLEWIDHLPGTKVMIKGNHDYWWSSVTQLRQKLPASCHVIQNDVYKWNAFSIGGTRLWDTSEYDFDKAIHYVPSPLVKAKEKDPLEDEKIFTRELSRLENSLKQLDQKADKRLVMTHYPPISNELLSSKTSHLLEKYHVDFCVFGHLHNVVEGSLQFGEKNGVKYLFTASDFLNFKPVKVI